METKTNRQIKRDAIAAIAYRLYKKYLGQGLTKQQAIDKARGHKSVMVCERAMRNYIKLMEDAA
jgi:hypothetical protein